MFAILRQRDFGLLWLSGLISVIGDFALIVALPLHIYKLTDSTIATAGAFAATFVPRVLFGSIAGVFVDRWDRKRTMFVADLARAVLLLSLLVAANHLAVLYVVAAIQGTIGLFFRPAESSLLPLLVGKERLVAANAMNSLNDNLGMLIGPALGAALYAWAGLGFVALVDSVSFVGSALLIMMIKSNARPPANTTIDTGASPWTKMIVDLRAGMRVVRHDRVLSVVFISSWLGAISEGIFLTLALAPFVLDVLGGTEAQVGWLGAAQAIGGLMAGLIIVRIGHRFAQRRLFGVGMFALGITDFGAFNARLIAGPGTAAVGVAMGWMVLSGVPVVAYSSGRQSIVQAQTDDAYRGRVFGSLGSVEGIAILIGLGLGGVLGNSIGIVPVLSASAALRLIGGVIALKFLPRDDPAKALDDDASLSEINSDFPLPTRLVENRD
jgi:MFS family permease